MAEELKKNMTAAVEGNTKSAVTTETLQSQTTVNVETIELDWNEERAKAWRKMQPPSKPSKSELTIYEKYINKKKGKSSTAENFNSRLNCRIS